jgi:hypothetical protein
MDTTKCISDNHWERYSRNLLGADEQHLLLQHVASCEICADVKEGIDLMNNPSNLSQINNQLQQQIHDRVRSEPKKSTPFFYWLAAAAVLLVATFGMLELSKKSDQQQAKINPLVQPDTLTKFEENKTIVLADKPKPKTKSRKQKAVRKPEITIPMVAVPGQVQSDESVSEESSAVLTKALTTSGEKQRQESEKESEMRVSTPQIDDAKDIKIESTTSKLPEQKKKKSAKPLSMPSNKAYNNNNQVFESDNYSNYSKNPPYSRMSDSLMILEATLYLERGVYDSALVQVKPLLLNSIGYWYEEARWVQALCLYGKGDKVNAKIIMQSLARGNGKRQKEAIILLSEWED